MKRPASALRKNLETVDAAAFAAAVEREIEARVAAFARGVVRFAEASRPAPPPPLPEIWAEGTTRVLRAAAHGPPVVVVPSLVNRARILDLGAAQSLVRHLAAAGLDTYLVDWQAPGAVEIGFGLDDYVDRLRRLRDHVAERTGRRPMLLGYCMGGLLALALAARDPARVAKLALLATPWDFHATPKAARTALAASMPALRALVGATGALPVDVLQAMFAGLDPGATLRKFRDFAATPPDSPAAEAFVRLEDWLNDGVPLAGAVALHCLQDWYIDNAPMAGTWTSGGHVVDPARLDLPALVVIPGADRIVPPASARALAERLPRAEVLDAAAGHIGMVAGSRARRVLFEPLAAWLSAPLAEGEARVEKPADLT